MAKLDARTEFNPTTSSTPTLTARRRTNQFEGYSDDDEELAEATATHLKLNSSDSSGHERTNNLLTEEETQTRNHANNAELTEDDEDDIFYKRIIKNTYVSTIYNYMTGKKNAEEAAAQEAREYSRSNTNYRTRLSNRNKHLTNNGNGYGSNGSAYRYSPLQEKKTKNHWRWLWLLMILLSIVWFSYQLYSGDILSNLLSYISFSKFSFYQPVYTANKGDPFFDNDRYQVEIIKLRQELLGLKEMVNRQHEQHQTAGKLPTGPGQEEFDEILRKLRELEFRITSCCQKNSTALIEEEVRLLIEGKWLAEIEKRYDHQLKTEMNQLKEHLIVYVKNYAQEVSNQKMYEGSSGVSTTDDQNTMELLIRKALAKYDADKTGEADYALESTGAYIISTRCSESYQMHSANYQIFGITVWRSVNSPRELIQPRVIPGECWCFRGASGRVAIHLATRIAPTAIAYEHIPKALSREGNIDSAPSSFAIYGLNTADDLEPEFLGRYTYSIDGEPLQRFELTSKDVASKGWSMMEMVIDGNHGHPEYTCLYRLRVHGVPLITNVP